MSVPYQETKEPLLQQILNIAGCLLYAVVSVGVTAGIVMLFLRGGQWIGDNVLPPAAFMAIASLVTLLPLSLLFIVFKKLVLGAA